jgi:outer membrane protein assembly factor BamB
VRRGTLGLFAICLACQPLDRRDGALVIALIRAPASVDGIDVIVRAGGRSFRELVPRPADDRITSFSAVPAGPGEVDLKLFAGSELVDARDAIPVEIVEGEVSEITVNFERGPDFTIIEPVEGEPHLLFGGPIIPVAIELVNAELMVDVTATANREPVALARAGTGFIGTIDPAIAGDVLPATITLEITACLADARSDCIQRTRAIEVTRASFRVEVAPATPSRPVKWGEAIVVADGAGMVHAVTSTSGARVFEPIDLGAPVNEDIAVVGDMLYATAADGRVFVVDLSAEQIAEELELGATSAPVAGPSGVIVAADRNLISIGDRRTIASLPRRVRAPPLVDEDGIVAADTQGNVLALDGAGAQLFLVNVGGTIYAQPVRFAGRIVVATNVGGELIHLDPLDGGEVERVSFDLISHAPLAIGDRLIVAAGDRVVFIQGDRTTAQPVNSNITGAPVAWGDAVVVGMQSGLVRRVTEGGSRVIARVEGAALGLSVIESLGPGRGAGIAAIGSRGDFALLEPEEGF